MGWKASKNNKNRLKKKNKTLKTIKVRKLTVKDLPQVIRIQEAITRSRISTKRKVILGEHIRKKDNIDLGAFVEGHIVGFVISEIMTNSFGIDKAGWIKNMGVDSKYMGEGIGQALATHLFEVYKKRKIYEIYTAAQWDAVDLLSFFKLIGFDRSNFINLRKKLKHQE
jgi:ribosomal protein S18 acetylase RimI-like enzyme